MNFLAELSANSVQSRSVSIQREVTVKTRSELNTKWRFVKLAATSVAEALPLSVDQGELVTIPHTVLPLRPTHGDHTASFGIYQYSCTITISAEQKHQTTYLDFDGAMTAATVIVNGQRFPEHRGGYTPFSVDITTALRIGENELVILLDTSERTDIPPFGGRVDFLAPGGIYREIFLRSVDAVHVTDLFVRSDRVSNEGIIDCRIELTNTTEYPAERIGELVLLDLKGKLVARHRTTFMIAPGSTVEAIELAVGPTPLTVWTLTNPTLYRAQCLLWDTSADAEHPSDQFETRFGVRTATFTTDGTFLLNDEPIFLVGLNRHQTFPWIGGAAPKRLQQYDADLIKYELGCSIVRTSHYPQSPHFLDRCDEIGLLVFEEIPGWQHLGDAPWKELCLRDVEAMIRRDRNHPSIIMWGVRVNESPDDHDLYTATNALARTLDPTRPTGGVRNFLESEFLEDVFTFNDFSENILPPRHRPHLISECSGHMFPTKSSDNAERRITHALRYAQLLNRAKSTPGIAGLIGWCAFDYNTHHEFGSGDRVCYHGVMDMWRLPKYAASFFASQVAPETKPFIRVASHWSVGDHNGGGVRPLVVFSNCEAIEVWLGDALFGTFSPARDRYPYLEYPPFLVEGITEVVQWNHGFPDLRVVGLRDGIATVEHRVEAAARPAQVVLTPAHTTLRADGRDTTIVQLCIADKYGNPIPYVDGVVRVMLEGADNPTVRLIGDDCFAIPGGQRGLVVQATNNTGETTILVSYEGLQGACSLFTHAGSGEEPYGATCKDT